MYNGKYEARRQGPIIRIEMIVMETESRKQTASYIGSYRNYQSPNVRKSPILTQHSFTKL